MMTLETFCILVLTCPKVLVKLCTSVPGTTRVHFAVRTAIEDEYRRAAIIHNPLKEKEKTTWLDWSHPMVEKV